MPADDSPAILVARFLRTNNYTETLDAFLSEAGLPPDAGSGSSKALTIEQVLQEKKAYDLSVNFEKLGVEEKATAWTKNAPSLCKAISMPTSTNILCLSFDDLCFDPDARGVQRVLLASTVERRLHILRAKDSDFEIVPSGLAVQDSPILSFTVILHSYIVFTTMSGRTVTYDARKDTIINERKDHTKYVVQVAKYETSDDMLWLATAGWDGKVLLYHCQASTTNDDASTLTLGEPVATLPQQTNPEAIHFVRNPDTDQLFLLVTRRDSSFLYYYHVPTTSQAAAQVGIPLTGRQNLAPHSNAWVAFTPSALAPHPRDPTLYAVATSAVPHMKLLIVRLLFPGPDSLVQAPPGDPRVEPTRPSSLLDGPSPATIQARAALALQDKEAAAISIHATTMAPQTQYSTPGLAWRPDGSGVWVNGDDGAVRGIETSTGKVIAKLEGGHEAGSKVRCLCAGFVGQEGMEKEVVVSGGFDQRLIGWTQE